MVRDKYQIPQPPQVDLYSPGAYNVKILKKEIISPKRTQVQSYNVQHHRSIAQITETISSAEGDNEIQHGVRYMVSIFEILSIFLDEERTDRTLGRHCERYNG